VVTASVIASIAIIRPLFASPVTIRHRGTWMLRGLWALLVLAVATTVCGIPAMIGDLLFPRSNMTTRLGRVWSRVMLRAVGARVEFEGLEFLDSGRPTVYVSNHLSNVDIWALLLVLPLETRFVAKQELRRIPVLGWAMAASGFVFVDRKNRTRAIHSLEAAAQTIRSGRSVVVFPEGTRSRDGHLQPFKKGPFHLALRADVRLIPVAISGSRDVLEPGSLRVTPGNVTVRFLPPVALERWQPDDSTGLLGEVRGRIVAALAGGDAS
jgi:1-acyl-sn-glycerol-3-phosphate acyltransferase